MVNELNKEISNYQRFLSGEYCNYLDTEVLAGQKTIYVS